MHGTFLPLITIQFYTLNSNLLLIFRFLIFIFLLSFFFFSDDEEVNILIAKMIEYLKNVKIKTNHENEDEFQFFFSLGKPVVITIARSAVDGFIPVNPFYCPTENHGFLTEEKFDSSTSHSLTSKHSTPLFATTTTSDTTSSTTSNTTSISLPQKSYPGVDEIQKKVLLAVETLLEYWESQEKEVEKGRENSTHKVFNLDSKKLEEAYVENNAIRNKNQNNYDEKAENNGDKSKKEKEKETNNNFQIKAPTHSRIRIHDLTVDAEERAYVMFLHPSLRK